MTKVLTTYENLQRQAKDYHVAMELWKRKYQEEQNKVLLVKQQLCAAQLKARSLEEELLELREQSIDKKDGQQMQVKQDDSSSNLGKKEKECKKKKKVLKRKKTLFGTMWEKTKQNEKIGEETNVDKEKSQSIGTLMAMFQSERSQMQSEILSLKNTIKSLVSQQQSQNQKQVSTQYKSENNGSASNSICANLNNDLFFYQSIDEKPITKAFSSPQELRKRSDKNWQQTKLVTEVRKYASTKNSFQPSLSNDLSVSMLREVMTSICNLLLITDASMIVDKIRELLKIAESVTILEKFIHRIVQLLIQSNHAPDVLYAQSKNPKSVFDQVIPTLQQWHTQLDDIEELNCFCQSILDALRNRVVTHPDVPGHNGKNHLFAVGSNKWAENKKSKANAMADMVRQIRELIKNEEYVKTIFAAGQTVTMFYLKIFPPIHRLNTIIAFVVKQTG
ncbi:hypothetical protein RFI_06804 [Reticulomyxa filosa]|uniref:Centrosomal protein of 70 kDa n=1 Tax=Reticulomyxa filosa TaxID=46433 RepID=X6NYE8_RETFI|nr:hypothetical protein RFI_06804 [Reticulomyxa filosa]|eukprot:ETO30317.1 hypothetical protein RFI_06804 [Reticulomyxa filosa]